MSAQDRNDDHQLRPIARPVGSSTDHEFAPVSGPRDADPAHDIGHEPGSLPPRSQARLRSLSDSLTPLDWQVVTTVSRFRLLTGQQLARRFFPRNDAGRRACRRLLLRLVRSDVLMRLERRIGGVKGGSAGFIYATGLNGQKLLGQGRRARRHREPGWPFLRHTLAIAEVYVQLCEAVTEQADDDLVVFDPEPLCWRSVPLAQGGRAELRPDAYVVVDRAQRRQFWFVEVDRGTESASVIRTKLQQYLDWLDLGVEQERLHGVFPRVLWHSTDQRRVRSLRRLIDAAAGPPGLHVTDGLLPRPPRRAAVAPGFRATSPPTTKGGANEQP